VGTTTKAQIQPQAGDARVDPVVLPDVSTQPHPAAPTTDPVGTGTLPAGLEQLQKVLPEIAEVAQKVGGFKKLSEIADTLDEMET
jgi:hypothetical protein